MCLTSPIGLAGTAPETRVTRDLLWAKRQARAFAEERSDRKLPSAFPLPTPQTLPHVRPTLRLTNKSISW